ncbi:hypothetical protein MCN98_07995 [Flavobacteriaceae bacterium LSUCC0859]|nr:hypothetical protein [Flavobacteriaceae bacterium LSUCC0859]
MTAALEALATRLTTLETDLAGAATAAEVTALQTALAAAQADLTELLASNNVYSNDLTINSQATLDVAKSLGGKLAIINGGVTITQSSSMDAEDLQAVVDVMVTVTGNVTYTMAVNGSTQAVFNNLTSVGGLNLDVSGAINFPELQNAGAVVLDDTHKNYVTSVEFPKLSKVTSFKTGSDANTIKFSKATAITLSELANYENASLTLEGKLDFTLDLAKLTSKTAAGVKNPINLTIKGAKEVTLPEFTSGKVIADSSEKVVLAKYEGNIGDSFAKTEYLHLEVYEEDYTSSSTSLDTLIFGGVAESSDTDSGDHPTLDLDGASGLTNLTVKGKLYKLYLKGNTSLTDVDVTGAINSVTVEGATSLEALVLGHTGAAIAADKDEADLTIKGNTELASLTVDALVNAADLTITGNTSLETISFAKLAGIGVDAVPVVDVSNNNLTASVVEKDTNGSTDAVTAAGGTGSITTTSGMDDLKAYLGAAATKAAATAGASVYASFDTVETYIDTADAQTGPFNFTVGAKGQGNNVYTEIVYISPAEGADKFPNRTSYIIKDLMDGSDDKITIAANGGTVSYTKDATTETASEFVSRVVDTDALSANSVGLTKLTGINKHLDLTFTTDDATAAQGAYTATLLIGSTGYSSAVVTPTSYTNGKVEILVAASSGNAASDDATAFATAFNDKTKVKVYTYTASGTYTTTTVDYTSMYKATAAGGIVTLQPLKTVYTSATATETVIDLTSGARNLPVYTLFTDLVPATSTPNTTNVPTIATSIAKSDFGITVTDELYGTSNTFIASGSEAVSMADGATTTIATAVIAKINEDSTYDSTDGTREYHKTGVPYSNTLTRVEEVDKDNGVSANKKNITSWL